jgi:tRNA threonylcarbamoyladenosine biosynthesis protein TsaE
MKTACRSEAETIEFAVSLAGSLAGDEVFALVGELGCGKTTFVKGLARGLGIPVAVTSPTFTLVHHYRGGRLPLVHYDLYRLKKFAEIEALELEEELGGRSVVAIEWPQLVQSILPPERTRWIHFEERDPSEWLITVTSRKGAPST